MPEDDDAASYRRGNVPLDRQDSVLRSTNRQMELYDGLPRAWKRLVDVLPTKQDLEMVQLYLERLGEDLGYREIVRQFEVKYPGWIGPQDR